MPLMIAFSIKNNYETNARDIQYRNMREWNFYKRYNLELENARERLEVSIATVDEFHSDVGVPLSFASKLTLWKTGNPWRAL